MRLSVPVLGPAWLIELRVGLAALFLWMVARALRKPLEVANHWRHFLVLGLLNSALPFLLFALAARTISASLLSILNATAPIWGAVIGAIWTRRALGTRVLVGLALGVVGVAGLVGFDPATVRPGAALAIALGLGAAFSYGVATQYAKSARKIDPFANAHGSMWAAAVLVAPVLPFFANPVRPSAEIALAVIALGVLCSGVAYLLYFRLIADIGATSALTVTFLIPVFGVAWGHFFLGEAVGWHTLVGASLVITGTAIVTGFSPAAMLVRWRTDEMSGGP